jgi:hypothetical protein
MRLVFLEMNNRLSGCTTRRFAWWTSACSHGPGVSSLDGCTGVDGHAFIGGAVHLRARWYVLSRDAPSSAGIFVLEASD